MHIFDGGDTVPVWRSEDDLWSQLSSSTFTWVKFRLLDLFI